MPDKDEFRDQFDDQLDSRTEAAGAEMPDPLADLIADSLDTGENTVAFRDNRLTALLDALEERPDDMATLAERLQDALGRAPERRTDPEDVDRSELLRLLARVGLKHGAPDVYEDLGDAIRQSIEV